MQFPTLARRRNLKHIDELTFLRQYAWVEMCAQVQGLGLLAVWPCQGTVNLKRLIWNLCLHGLGAASNHHNHHNIKGFPDRHGEKWWKSGNPRLQRLRVKEVLSATSDRSAFADLGGESKTRPRCCIWILQIRQIHKTLRKSWSLHIGSFWKNCRTKYPQFIPVFKSHPLPSSMQVMGPPDGTQVCRTLLEGSIQMRGHLYCLPSYHGPI